MISSRAVLRAELMREVITSASRRMLKWLSGSKMMIAAFCPLNGTESKDAGRMARAAMRYSSDVFPAPDGWYGGGGETSSRTGGLGAWLCDSDNGVGVGSKVSSSGIPKYP